MTYTASGDSLTVTGRVVHSPDGKVRTVTSSVMAAGGKKIESTAVYDRM